jgi:hypothetical protein
MAHLWLVCRCPSCGRHHGSKVPAHRCPLCGHRSVPPFPVHAEAANAAELQRMVTLANTPEDLRDDLARRLDAVPSQRPREGGGPSAWLGLLRQVADEEGRLDVEHVADALRRAGEPVAAMDVLEHASSAGLVLHEGGARWRLLEER